MDKICTNLFFLFFFKMNLSCRQNVLSETKANLLLVKHFLNVKDLPSNVNTCVADTVTVKDYILRLFHL